ncbi:uncharacterized protein Z520_06122 [Fonsecaea multimorphosa CBS 102226]|uniref:SMP-30/Gluconolactonase/LRE-like region domain-containing protein n=1 Tax=Fonsecaea multimorphosa CBS 102226 TaxID=1442371 RepID=A0A0D2KMX5_9EURO|nr:uncharacterized protein Z520_06122 [Fonsecaea multimorphosa CBS 102226]KIX98043.1 hypothetical protein Z520_06122 [Fonsecaea multimorphosa CBS 102226]OAL24410.1 hypothetical protein AYO22_05786 [Fonsecaea multimorphosa]
MKIRPSLLSATILLGIAHGQVQAPALAGAGAPIAPADRIYCGDQSSNTITVISPYDNRVLGTIALGSSRLQDVIGPQYVRSTNSHGLGFSRDGKYIVSLSVTTNTVTVVRTIDNSIVSQTWTDRAPHEAFFAPDNRTVWVGTRGTNHVTVVDGLAGTILGTIHTADGPSKVVFSPDGATAYVNHIRDPILSIVDVASRTTVQNITGLNDVFSSDMQISADGGTIWTMHKMAGTASVIDLNARSVVTAVDIGAEVNHANFAVLNGTTHVFTTVGASNETKVFRQDSPGSAPVYLTSIRASGIEPHGIWGSPDNQWMFVVNEHSDTVDVISLSTMQVTDTLNVGQEGQALIYVANAVPQGDGTANLGTQGLSPTAALNKIVDIITPKLQPGSGEAMMPMPASNKTPTALVTIRSLGGLDMVQVIGRNIKLNTSYTMSATCQQCNGGQVPLLSFNATMKSPDGCGTAPQVLSFFKWYGVWDLESIQISET